MCGMGVTSLIMLTSRPAACNARIAASRPEPGPFTNTSTVLSPCSMAAFAAVSAAVCAAYGVLFLEPLKPSPPAEAHESALPWVSVMVTIVLLNVDWICAAPRSMFCARGVCEWLFFWQLLLPSSISLPDYFFLLAIVFLGPFLVRALVLVLCPRTGRPFLWRTPR